MKKSPTNPVRFSSIQLKKIVKLHSKNLFIQYDGIYKKFNALSQKLNFMSYAHSKAIHPPYPVHNVDGHYKTRHFYCLEYRHFK